MKNLTILLTSVAALAIAAPAFAADKEVVKSETKVEKDSEGNLKAKSETSKTDAAGTTTTSEKKVDVSVDSKGNTDKTVKTEEVTDPKGLMNKTVTKTKDTVKTSADGAVETGHKKVVNGTTVESSTEVTK